MIIDRRHLIAVACAISIGSSLPALADGKPYVTADDVPVLKLLAPPPANDSAQTRAELDAVLAIQASRTQAQADHAIADQEETVFRFLAGMGVVLDPAKLPLNKKLSANISETEEVVTDAGKKGFGRPRPPLVDAKVVPVVKLSKSNAYPSGHTTFGTVTGVVLAQMWPENKAAIFARINDFGNSRMVGGVHYASDIEAGKIAGTAIANALFHNEAFLGDFEAAKKELRTALGL
ncbi:MAG: phosphatase PAP2 family protein [Hyphomicrobiales bacterium]|nr:phosphatase PAP2 family protein [Hyphomicrobiales bacterium]